MINTTVLPIGCVKAAMNIQKTQMGHNLNHQPIQSLVRCDGKQSVTQPISSLNEYRVHNQFER